MMSLLWAILIGSIFMLRSVLLPFLLAALLAFVINPFINAASRLKIRGRYVPRPIGVLAAYLFLFALVYIFSVFFIPQIYHEIVRITKEASENVNHIDEAQIKIALKQVEEFFHRFGFPVELVPSTLPSENSYLFSIDLFNVAREMIVDFAELVRSHSSNIAVQVQQIVSGFVSFVFEIFLVLMITGFLLSDTLAIKRFLFSLVPNTQWPAFENFLNQLDRGLSGVVRGQLMICLVNAILTLVGLLLIGVKFSFVLATLAGIFSLVPIFGSIISTIPIVLVGLTQSLTVGLAALAWIIGVHFIEANFLNPKILGNSAKIHPVVVVLALVAGKHFYGLVGALLAVPVTSIMLTIFNSFLARAIELDQVAQKDRV